MSGGEERRLNWEGGLGFAEALLEPAGGEEGEEEDREGGGDGDEAAGVEAEGFDTFEGGEGVFEEVGVGRRWFGEEGPIGHVGAIVVEADEALAGVGGEGFPVGGIGGGHVDGAVAED